MTTPKRNEAVLRYDKRENDHSIELYEDGTFVDYADYAALQGEVSRLRDLLTAWYAEESRYSPRQAPGHAHQIRGVWDDDNGDLAGKPCAKCALWAEIKKIANLEPPTDG
jgi:hypothetical protein